VPELNDEPETEAPSGRHEATAFVIVGLLGIGMLALAVGLLFLPPGISFTLVRRGLSEDNTSWIVMGGVVALLWLVMLWATARKLLLRRGQAAVDRE
jgi:hypothetical protein